MLSTTYNPFGSMARKDLIGCSDGRSDIIYGDWSFVETEIFGKTCFKFVQGLRIDATIFQNKLFHLHSDATLDLQLFKIGRVQCDRILSEKVSDQHLLDV